MANAAVPPANAPPAPPPLPPAQPPLALLTLPREREELASNRHKMRAQIEPTHG